MVLLPINGELASAALPCPAGYYSYATDLGAAGAPSFGCTECDAGHYCTTGSTVQASCKPGTVQPSTGKKKCIWCEAGKYQSGLGQTECDECEAGSYCPEGASAPLPCSAGYYSTKTNLGAWGAPTFGCYNCTAGHMCTTGSTAQTPCAAGTVQPLAVQGSCEPCAAGTYRSTKGNTTCAACVPGSYCPEGASAALPCPVGYYSTATYLGAAGGPSFGCTACEAGHMCSMGSTAPAACAAGTVQPLAAQGSCEACAAGTFQPLPGNTTCIVLAPPPPAAPPPVAPGESTAQVLSFSATLAETVETFDQTAYIAALAAELGVSPDDITLDLSPGSLVVTATITSSNTTATAAAAAALQGRMPSLRLGLRSATRRVLNSKMRGAPRPPVFRESLYRTRRPPTAARAAARRSRPWATRGNICPTSTWASPALKTRR